MLHVGKPGQRQGPRKELDEVSASQYDLDYFRHVLRRVDAFQLDSSDILAMIDLVRAAVTEHRIGGHPPLTLAAPVA